MTHPTSHHSHALAGSYAKPHGPMSAEEHHQQMTDQAQKWVAQTFYGTLLKQMRDDPFKNKMLDGGRGGEVFGEMFDQRMAEHMSKSSGSKLVNSLVKKMEGKNQYRKQAQDAARKARTLQSPSLTASPSFSGRA